MNWNNYKLVKFDNGKFGVRRGWLFHEFVGEYGTWFLLFGSYKYIRLHCMLDEELANKKYNDLIIGVTAPSIKYEVIK